MAISYRVHRIQTVASRPSSSAWRSHQRGRVRGALGRTGPFEGATASSPRGEREALAADCKLAFGWSRATPRRRRDLLALLFDKLWIRRVHDTKWDAEHGQQVDMIDTYVPRSDYPMEVVGLVGLLVGAEGMISIDVPAVPTPGRHTFAESGKGGAGFQDIVHRCRKT